MPAIANQLGNETTMVSFWSKHRDDVSYNQLQKYWSQLSPQARQKLLRIDKQTLFEQARKNMYCSRCNGLLLEGFLQIVMYGKSMQQEGACKNQIEDNLCTRESCQDDVLDPSVHPWGGLTTTRDGMLTLLGSYLCSNSLKGLQNVFDSARSRERERELLYPDACGGGGRGWISQGMAGYGRGHGTRETCALHTARLSVDTLVDFWSALGEETQHSLLRMKEDDFIERLMFRFDSKRFCRDCRRNVIREFKELKELKRMRKEPRCTCWYCAADTAFQYEVSHDTVQADWHRTFIDTLGTYHHFEWAIGSGDGKTDILEFENVGLSGRVQVSGLDLGGLNACYISLRAYKMDGRCSELSVKAHALKGQKCVHGRLVVGDGFVTITRGESIRRFFEHAEEAEEEEDDDSMDKDGNELDGECSRPQKHAKSPELAREFLLDAATVIFKEQVEKAFREGTARQNAHSIFVCLALKLLEERVHVACKEIITFEKQTKLLEEEEKEKREEEERKERKRNKEREKKLRRKERLREKEKDKEKKSSESNKVPSLNVVPKENSTAMVDEKPKVIITEITEYIPASIENEDNKLFDEFTDSTTQVEFAHKKDGNDNLKHSIQKLNFRTEFHQDSNVKSPERRVINKHEQRHNGDNYGNNRNMNGLHKQSVNSNARNVGPKFHCSNTRMNERFDCSCNQHMMKVQETRSVKADPVTDMSKPYYRGPKFSPGGLKSKNVNPNHNNTNTRKVWEPTDSHKKYPRSNSYSDFTARGSGFNVEVTESEKVTEEIKDSKEANHLTAKKGEERELISFHGTSDSSISSDNCSSCLSEGDSSNSSSTNPQNTESDSDNASQNSEGRDIPISPRNIIPNAPETNNSVNNVAVTPVPNFDNARVNNAQAQIVLPPPMHNQSIHYPIFQAPSLGYYHHHQSPMSWGGGPTNGFMPYPHPNPYVYPTPFGYGLNGNTRYMQYGGLQHMGPPQVNHGHFTTVQQVAHTNGVHSNEHVHITNPGGLKEANQGYISPAKIEHPKEAPKMESGQNGSNGENTGFSLFHFGGPIALSNGFKAEKEGVVTTGEFSSSFPSGADRECDKKNGIEEYNLFASSNGLKFSFF